MHPAAPDGLPISLWSDDWYDSAGDGSVQAIVKPKDGGERLREIVGASSIADLKFLDYGTAAPQAGSAASITAMPGWVVDRMPGLRARHGPLRVALGHRARPRLSQHRDGRRRRAARQPHAHEEPRDDGLDKYKHTDYLIHIHPQLCLFDDVKFVSGEAFGDPENRPAPAEGRAHNIHPSLPGGPPPAATASAAIKQRRHAHQRAREQGQAEGSRETEGHGRRKADCPRG